MNTDLAGNEQFHKSSHDKSLRSHEKISRSALFLFAGLLLLCSLFSFLLPDQDISTTERRHLASFPELTSSALLDGSFTSDLESYLLDHFAGRDFLRSVKTSFSLYALGQKDVNNYYQADHGLYEISAALNEKNIQRAGIQFQKISSTYFPLANSYYAVIPDKNYFVSRAHGYPRLDYERLLTLYQENMSGSAYIDLFDQLTIDDYYKTDLHWKQESLLPIADALLSSMETTINSSCASNRYEQILYSDSFYGGYAGSSAIHTAPDKLLYLTSDMLDQITVYDYEKKESVPVYAKASQSLDPYDLFLWGARALLRMDNPARTNGRTLILFRDSFGSSLAPLLAEGYSRIYLVDLRYVSAQTAGSYIQAELPYAGTDTDVLFLYSTTLLNKSDSMRF